MRLESDDDGMRLRSLRPPDNLIDDRPVSAVHSIEVADADNRRTKVPRNVFEFVEDLHAKFFYRRDAENAEKLIQKVFSATPASRR